MSAAEHMAMLKGLIHAHEVLISELNRTMSGAMTRLSAARAELNYLEQKAAQR